MKRPTAASGEARPIDRRRLLRRAGHAGMACLALPVLAGCEILAAREDDRYTIEMTEQRRFEPSTLIIPVDSTVVWDNTGQRRHAVTTDAADLEDAQAIVLPDGVAPFESDDLFPGETWSLRFPVPGRYVYVCPYHHEEGMIGTIVVED